MTKSVLVTGATGNIGRHVVAGLGERGVAVRAMTRTPGAVHLPGAEVVAGDLTVPDSFAEAIDGMDAVFLLWPFMTPDGADAVASAIGSRPVVYVSAMSAPQGGVWGGVEDALRAAGSAWTFLRPGGFATNTLEWAPAIRAGEPVRMPYPNAARSLIHERDIADVAVRVLTADGHAGRVYELTGPSAPTMAEQVKIIGDAVSARPTVVEQPLDEARAQLEQWTGKEFAAAALGYWAGLVDQPEPVTGAVAEILGRPARGFAEWAADHADDFRALPAAEVADRYTEAFRQGRMDLATRWYSPGIVRVAPIEGGGELRGLPSIMDNAARRNSGPEIRGVTVDGPFVHGNRFAVRFELDRGELTETKMSLYTVHNGAISREEVYYFDVAAPSTVG